MLISSSPCSFPLCKLLLLDPPAQIFFKMQKIQARRHQIEGRLREGKGRKDAKSSIKGKGGKYSRELVISWKSTISRGKLSS